MPTENTAALAAKTAQSQAAKRATMELLRSKKRSTREVSLLIPTGDGETAATFLLQAVSAQKYDKLITEHPATVEQRAEGASYNLHTFAPALLALVVVEPELSYDEWAEIWNSPNWNRGELMGFFGEAVDLCNRGLSLGPTVTG